MTMARRALLAFAVVCAALLPCSVAFAAPGKPVITNGPLPWTTETSATFDFSSAGADSFTCILDGGQDPGCLPGFPYPVPQGAHSFQVVAFDSVGDPGNPSEPSDPYDWTVDTTDPNVPDDISAEATSPSGANVSFAANDNLDPSPTLTGCSNASGSTFPLGDTDVSCTATDAAGNSESGSFTVTVQDTTPPTLAPHQDVLRSQQSSAGAVVLYALPVAQDIADPSPSVQCNPASGSTFAIGETQVTCTATDDAGQTSAPGTFMVIVQQGAVPGAPGIHASVGPPGVLTRSRQVTFELALEAGASADCQLDTPSGPGSFADCDGPTQTYEGLGDGAYLFTVQVTNGVGNVSQANYPWTVDRTGPVRVAGFAGRAGSHIVRLRWTKPIDDDYDKVRIWRKRASASHWKRLRDRVDRASFVDRTVTNHVRYLYRIRSLDRLGNASRGRQLSAWPTPIFSPRFSAVVHSPPIVDWTSVRHADYYNLQLWRDGKKIFTIWPIDSSYRLRSSWRFKGRTQMLIGGRVTVYVWPGFGPKARADYGPLHGQTRFTLG